MAEKDPISEAISNAIQPLIVENQNLQESLGDALASIKFEDRGWLKLFGLADNGHLKGLDLDELKQISERMRIKTALGGLYKRGADLHTGYTHGKGANIPGAIPSGGRGRPDVLQTFYKVNFEILFSANAKGVLQKARYTDGNIFALCESGKRVRLIPLDEIVDVKVDPEFTDDVWAYLREWETLNGRGEIITKKAWYYTQRFPGTRQKSYTRDGATIPVASGTIVDFRANRQSGWALGIPDVAAAAPWIEAYNEIMQYGRVVNESLAKILFKIINPTKAAAVNSAAKIAGMKGHGNAASMTEGADVQAISTAGKGYDFTAARPVGAQAASALNVPLMEFLADTSAAGSSYGSAQALVPSVLNAMMIMQEEFADFLASIFIQYGIAAPKITFDPIVEPDFYRQVQGLTLASVALSDEEYRAEVLDILNIDGDPKAIPETLKVRSQPQQQAASPDQGRNSAAGSSDSGSRNDQRTDTIGEALKAMQLDKMTELVERWEIVANKLQD